MKHLFTLIFFLLIKCVLWAQIDTAQKIIQERKNSPEQEQKPYVILISADGFRYDYAKKHKATNLLKLSQQGVAAASLIPSYPSLTFPNHYTIVTGLYPSHHGIVSNYFYDRQRKEGYSMRNPRDSSWYGGTPLWVLAEQQQMLTASFYWVGSEAAIKGIYPTYYYHYNESIDIDRRIEVVVNWLQLSEERRPHLITFYFPEVDHQGHAYGPDAPETRDAVKFVDNSIQKLVNAVNQTGLPVNFIFVSDHGMTTIDAAHPLSIPAVVDSSRFIIPRASEMVALYAIDSSFITDTYKKLKQQENGFTAYVKSNMPAKLHYSEQDDIMNRIGDILLVPTWPKVFSISRNKPNRASHGFDPYLVKDMHATFYAWGPAFKKRIKIPSFENVHIYPIITKILGLTYTEKIDGIEAVANQILK